MDKIIDRTAGEFIDLHNYFTEMCEFEEKTEEEKIDVIKKFFVLLNGQMFETDEECLLLLQIYSSQLKKIKDDYEFVYNPPEMPSSTEESVQTIGDEYRKEFAEMYGGYIGMTLIICKIFPYTPEQVMQMKAKDFLFWGNLLLHRQFTENIK